MSRSVKENRYVRSGKKQNSEQDQPAQNPHSPDNIEVCIGVVLSLDACRLQPEIRKRPDHPRHEDADVKQTKVIGNQQPKQNRQPDKVQQEHETSQTYQPDPSLDRSTVDIHLQIAVAL